MKEQTAVEWLVKELENHHIKIDIKNTVVYQQAKEMEKKQIMEAYNNGEDRSAELYYNETFKSE
jgi:hypothetical protein